MSVVRVGMDEARAANAFFLAFDRSNPDRAVVEGRFVVQVHLHGGLLFNILLLLRQNWF